ncbi:hypothetical protein KCU81_g75, partial [Aureobasidium melanogenum]
LVKRLDPTVSVRERTSVELYTETVRIWTVKLLRKRHVPSNSAREGALSMTKCQRLMTRRAIMPRSKLFVTFEDRWCLDAARRDMRREVVAEGHKGKMVIGCGKIVTRVYGWAKECAAFNAANRSACHLDVLLEPDATSLLTEKLYVA